MHTIVLTCSNAGGSCLHKATLLHLPPCRLPAQPSPQSWGQERVVDVGGNARVCYHRTIMRNLHLWVDGKEGHFYWWIAVL